MSVLACVDKNIAFKFIGASNVVGYQNMSSIREQMSPYVGMCQKTVASMQLLAFKRR